MHEKKQIKIMRKMIEIYQRVVALFMKKKEVETIKDANMDKVYRTALESVGQDLCNVSPELGCVVTLNEIFLRAIGQEAGGGDSTYRLYQSLKTDTRFEKVTQPRPGTLVLSATGTGNGSMAHGHAGIMGTDYKIISNNSQTGLVDDHYNLWSWRTKFEKHGGFPTLFYNIL